MVKVVRPARRLRGVIEPPGDKSISHRSAILNALARGRAAVENFLRGADCLATLRCLRLLGVPWHWREDGALVVDGVGLEGLQEPPAPLDCRNSGTTMRLLAGVLAGQPFFSVLTGDASLRSRPMGRIVVPLRQMGAQVWGRDGGELAPLAVLGRRPLRALSYRLPVASAQVKSCLLLAGLYAEGETRLWEPGPSRDHTERMLGAMGADLRAEDGWLSLRPVSGLNPLSLRVPGDFSAAAFWLVAAAVHPDAEVRLVGVGVNPTRTGLLDVLRLMGADIRLCNETTCGGEPVADIVVRSSSLRGVEVDPDMVPRLVDEVPLLALAACFAQGETVVRGARELRVKESDRLWATARELGRLGADIEELDDGLCIRGGIRLRGCRVKSYGDHRLAMMLAVAGLLATGETEIGNAEAVLVSYPEFWRELERIASDS